MKRAVFCGMLGWTVVALAIVWGFLCVGAACGVTVLTAEDIAALQGAQVAQKAGRYEEAEAAYLRIMAAYPLAEEAFESRMHLAVVHAATGRLSGAVAWFEKTAQTFATDGRAEEAFRVIAYDSLRCPNHAEALRFCRAAVDVCPGEVKGLWAQAALVISKGNTNEPNEAQAVADLLGNCFGDPQAPEAISVAAWNYRRLKKPDAARVLYRYVVDNWPGAEQAIYAQRGVVRTFAAVNDMQGADGAVATLLEKFRGDDRLATVASDLGREFMDMGQRRRARKLFQYVVDNHVAAPQAMTAQVRAVQLSIELADSAAAAGGFANLVARWPTAEKLPQMIVWIADSYRKTGQWRNAGLLCEHVVSEHGDDPYARVAEAVGWACSDAALVSDANTPDAADRLFAAHPDDAMTAKAAYIGAETLRDRAAACGAQGQGELEQLLWHKTARMCETVSERSPESSYAGRAMILRGDCLGRLGQASQAAACYRGAAARWPDHELAWSALLKLARACETAGGASRGSTRAAIRSCYVRLVNQYPDCPGAAYARHWLSRNSD